MQQKIICHLIAGFLGSGKTHLIQQLIALKPEHERWVILVNEAGQQSYPVEQLKAQKIIVKTVLGGCLCCTAGVPFRVALNAVIKQVQPTRIFIEPAGAGHLMNIQTLLRGPFYHSILHIAASYCLLNATHLNNPHYAEHTHYLKLIEHTDILLMQAGEARQQAINMAGKCSKPLWILQGDDADLRRILSPAAMT